MALYQIVTKYNISKSLFLVYSVFIALIIYFSFLIFFSQKGLIKYLSLRAELAQQNIEKKQLINEIELKKSKVSGMKSGSLDLDLLDEEARKNLGYSKENEIIIFEEKNHDKK